jgi:hypothetical protein
VSVGRHGVQGCPLRVQGPSDGRGLPAYDAGAVCGCRSVPLGAKYPPPRGLSVSTVLP